MAKFVLTAQFKIQPPSPQDVDKIHTAITDKFKNFTIPLKISIKKGLAKGITTDLDKLNKALDVTANKFGLFIVQVRSAFNHLQNMQFITTAFNNLIQQMNRGVRAVNTLTTGVNNLVSRNQYAQYTLNGLTHALRTMQGTASRTSSAANDTGDAIFNMGQDAAKAIRRFGSFTIITTSFFSLINAIQASVREAVLFEAEVIKLRQVTGHSVVGIKELTDEVDRLSVGLGVSSKELLDVTVVLAQAGLTAKDTQKSLEAIAKASLSPSFDDMNSIVEGSIAIFQQFNVKATDLEKVLGSMSAVAAKFAVESEDLNIAIRRTGGAFQAAGGDIQELFALFTSVRATTRESAESIATGFRTIFARLQRSRTQDFLKQFGVNLRYTREEAQKLGVAANSFVGPFEAISRLSNVLNTVSPADPRFSQIIEELGGFRQISKVIPLIKQNALAQRALQVATEGTNSLTRDAETAQESLLNQLIKVREEFQLFIRDLTENSTFKHLIGNVLELARALLRLGESLTPIIPALTALGIAQVGINGGNYLRGLSSGFAFPGTGGSGGQRPSFGLPSSGTQALQLANSNMPQLVTLSIVASSLTSHFKVLDKETTRIVEGFSNLATQFLVFQQIVRNLPPFSGPTNRIASVNADIATGENNLRDIRRRGAHFGHWASRTPQTQALARANVQAYLRQRRQLTNLRGQLPDLQSQETQMLAVASAIAAVVSASSVYASYLEKEADAKLRILRETGGSGDRSGFISSSTLSGGISLGGTGAGIGAGIGALVAGIPSLGIGVPVGAAVGAGIGGTIGGSIGAFQSNKTAQNILDQIDFNERFGKTSSTLGRVNAGERLATDALSDVRTGFLGLRDELRTVSDPNRRTDILAAGRNETINLSTFLKSIALTTKNVDEFRSLVGDDLITTFTYLADKSLPDFLNEIDQAIKGQSQFNKINEQAIKIEIERQSIVQTQILFSAALEQSIVNLEDFSASISSLGSFAGGGSGLTGRTSFSALRQLGSDNPILDIDQFTKDINKLGSALGPSGKQQTNRVIGAATVSNQLPNILLGLVGKGALAGEGQFADRLRETLQDQFGNILDKDLINSLVNQADEIAGEAQEDSRIFDLFATDPQSAIKKFTDVLTGQGKALESAGSIIQEKFNEYAEGLSQIISLNRNYVEELNTVLDLVSARDKFLTGAFNQRGNFGFQRDLDLQRQLNIVGNAPGLVNNPLAVGGKLNTLQQKESTIQGRLQSADLTSEQRQREIQQLTTTQLEISQLTDALKFMADASSRAATDLEELGDLQSRRQARLSLFTSFLGADNSGRRDIRRNIAAANNAALAGNLSGVRQDQRGEVLRLLEGINPEKFKEILANEAKNLGIDPKGLLTPDDKEAQLIQQVVDKYDIAIKAQELYTKSLETNIDKFIKAQDAYLTRFLTDFQTIFDSQFKKQLEEQKAGKELQKGVIDANLGRVDSLTKLSGTNNIGAIRRFVELNKNVPISNKAVESTLQGLQGNQSYNSSNRNARRAVLGGFGVAGIAAGFANPPGVDSFRTEAEIRKKITATINGLGLSEERGRKLESDILNRIGEASDGTNDINKFKTSKLDSIFVDEFTKLNNELIKNQRDFETERSRLVGDLGGDKNAANVLRNTKTIEDILKDLPKDFNLDANTKELQQLNLQIKELNRKLGGQGFANGGFIPGSGNKDNTLIKTTPGEFVVRKPVAQKFGGMLAMLNKTGRLPAFANGGFVGGGGDSGFSALNAAMSAFGMHVGRMAEALNSIPRNITMNATHTVNVMHNGAQVFAGLEPAIIRLIEVSTSKAINKMLSNKFPDVGHMADADLFNGGGLMGGVNFNG